MFVEQSLTKNADGEGDDEAGCVRLEPAVPCSLWPHVALGVGGHNATQPRSSPQDCSETPFNSQINSPLILNYATKCKMEISACFQSISSCLPKLPFLITY